MLTFGILGPLEVSAESRLVRLGGPKQRATLAILLLNANTVVSVDRLADDLYGGASPVTAATQVQRQISELRKALGSASAIETRPPGYVLRLSPEQLDLQTFERQVQEATTALGRGDAAQAAELLRRALGLWRGPALSDLAYEPFAHAAIERLEEMRVAALEERVRADLAVGRHAELAGELRELVADHPLRERLCAQLMLALYRSGRQTEALEAYRRTRRTLADEFGIEPEPTLEALERAILTHSPSLDLHGEAAPYRPVTPARPARAVLVVPRDDTGWSGLLRVGPGPGEPSGSGADRCSSPVRGDRLAAIGVRSQRLPCPPQWSGAYRCVHHTRSACGHRQARDGLRRRPGTRRHSLSVRREPPAGGPCGALRAVPGRCWCAHAIGGRSPTRRGHLRALRGKQT